MIVTVLFLALMLSVVAWRLSRKGAAIALTTEPWLEEGAGREIAFRNPSSSAARMGLAVFLAVVGVLFTLLVGVYFMRMEAPDWRPPPAPGILWFNTGALIMSSVALQYARSAARAAETDRLGVFLIAATVLALVFLLGQLSAWRQLSAAGFFAASNPANAFFYLLTGMHGLHLTGGLTALARTAAKFWRGRDASRTRAGVELCAIYWHVMLAIWIVIFALLIV